MKKILLLLAVLPLLAGCPSASMPTPTAFSHEHVTKDKSHWAVQIAMHTGIPNTPRQTAMVIYSKFDKKPIAIVNGQTKIMSEELASQLLGVVAGLGAAAIGGSFVLQAAKADCPTGSLCGTLVQVQNQAGAQAGSQSTANANSN